MNHSSNSCHIVTEISTRKEVLKNKNRCFNCLAFGHTVKNCTKKSKCFTCNEKHHISICEKKLNKSKHNPINPSLNGPDVPTTMFIDNIKYTLLHTATANIGSVNSSKKITSRVLFDTGSQRMFITKELQKNLTLTPTKWKAIMIQPFGKENHSIENLDSDAMRIRNLQTIQFKIVEAFDVPTISKSVKNQLIKDVQEQYTHLVDIQLADSNSTNSDTNIALIGADLYWSFITEKARQSPLGPTAVELIFGWVLSGPYETNVWPTLTNIVNSHILKLATEPSLDTKLDLKLKQFWKYEASNTNTTTKSSDFNLKKIESQITFNGDKYKVPLPWKTFHKPLP